MNIEIQIPDGLRNVTVRIDAEGNFCMMGRVVGDGEESDSGGVQTVLIGKRGRIKRDAAYYRGRRAAKAGKRMAEEGVAYRRGWESVMRGNATESQRNATKTQRNATETPQAATPPQQGVTMAEVLENKGVEGGSATIATPQNATVAPQRIWLIDCLEDSNINNLNLNTINQSVNQGKPQPVAQPPTMAKEEKRHRTKFFHGDQILLPGLLEGDRENLLPKCIQDALQRWIRHRRQKGFFKMSILLYEELLDAVDEVAAKHGLREAVRWIDEQTRNDRMNCFLPYRPPPKKVLADWEKPMKPEERCTPEDVAEARRKLGFLK